MFCRYRLNVRNLYACGTRLADINRGHEQFSQPCECRAQGLCESRGGRPGLPVLNKPYGFCGPKAPLRLSIRAQELCESQGGRPGFPSLICLYGLCGRKETLNEQEVSKHVSHSS